MYNDYFFVRLMCGVNQTHRFIVCCSQRDFCNDLDAYSNEIRHALTASPMNGEICFLSYPSKTIDRFRETSTTQWFFDVYFDHDYLHYICIGITHWWYIYLY